MLLSSIHDEKTEVKRSEVICQVTQLLKSRAETEPGVSPGTHARDHSSALLIWLEEML